MYLFFNFYFCTNVPPVDLTSIITNTRCHFWLKRMLHANYGFLTFTKYYTLLIKHMMYVSSVLNFLC
jgi:hypothetical protein